MKLTKLSPVVIGLLQAAGFVLYASLVGNVMLHGNQWFGQNLGILGPILFLTVFVFSAIISAGLLLGYPFYLFWEKKDLKLAIKIVVSSTVWLLIFVLAIILLLASAR